MKNLNKFLGLLVIVLVIFVNVSRGQLLTEDFSYASASTLVSQGGWLQTGATATNPITVTAFGLTYSGYAGSGIGNAVALVTSGQDVNRPYTPTQNSGSVYYAFMVNVSASQLTGDYFLHFSDGGTTLFFSKVFIKKDPSSTNFAFGIAKNQNASVTYTGYAYALGTTYLIVTKYTFNSGTTTDDVASLFVNPDLSGTEPTPTLTQTDAGSDATVISAICLRQGTAANASTLTVDGCRAATVWSDIPMPITLSSLNSTVIGRNININWTTSSEQNNSGFEVQRALVDRNGVIGNYSKVTFVNGSGTTYEQKSYSYTDCNLNTGKYKYKLKQIDYNGNFEFFNLNGVVEIGVPNKFDVSQNYPNPFNPTTKINFDLPTDSKVTLVIYDISGREVANLLNNEFRAAGYQTVEFNASKFASGVYFYSFSTETFRMTKRMMLIK